MAENNITRGRIRQANEMDDEAFGLSVEELERRDEFLALQVTRYQELAAAHRQAERMRRQAREREQIMRADEELAAALAAEEGGIVGATQYDREVADALAREPGGDNDFNFGEILRDAGGEDGGYGHNAGERYQEEYDHDHDHVHDFEYGDPHEHDHDNDHGDDHIHRPHHDFEDIEEAHDREPLFVAEEGQADDPMADGLAQHVVQRNGRIDLVRCTACRDQFRRDLLFQTTCEHFYCEDCLSHLFRSSVTDEELFPPRCCGNEMPLDRARRMLGANLAREFAIKAVEFSTPDRTYCHVQPCSTFLPPATIHNDIAVCPTCNERTCSHCKARSHEGDCPQDPGVQAVIELAQAEGWRRCGACSRMIELNQGCNHMTCLCGHQFCYLCGFRWRTCACPQWQPQRLLHRAAILVDRQPVRPAAAAPQPPWALAPAPRQNAFDPYLNPFAPRAPRQVPAAPDPRLQALRDERIQRMTAQLQENANCAHPLNWAATNGDPRRRGGCELCGRVKNRVYACRWCGIAACYACRRNRLR